LSIDYKTISEQNKVTSQELAEQTELSQQLYKTCSAFEQEVMYLREKTVAFDFFSVKRQGTKLISPTPCHIIMRKNVLGEYIIEIENPGEKITLHPTNIMACEVVKDSDDKFKLQYRIKGKMESETFLVQDPSKLSEALSNFITTAKDMAKPNGGTNGTQTHANKREKNLISEVVGFFGS